MLEPIEVYRDIEIRSMRTAGRFSDESRESLRYFCVVRGLTLTDQVSMDSLKKKIDKVIDKPLSDIGRKSQTQRMYRIVGISADGQRTTLASALPEPEALHL